MICPRCHSDRHFPREFARFSSPVLPWGGYPDQALGSSPPLAAPDDCVEFLVCRPCCAELEEMVAAFYPGLTTTISPLTETSRADS